TRRTAGHVEDVRRAVARVLGPGAAHAVGAVHEVISRERLAGAVVAGRVREPERPRGAVDSGAAARAVGPGALAGGGVAVAAAGAVRARVGVVERVRVRVRDVLERLLVVADAATRRRPVEIDRDDDPLQVLGPGAGRIGTGRVVEPDDVAVDRPPHVAAGEVSRGGIDGAPGNRAAAVQRTAVVDERLRARPVLLDGVVRALHAPGRAVDVRRVGGQSGQGDLVVGQRRDLLQL